MKFRAFGIVLTAVAVAACSDPQPPAVFRLAQGPGGCERPETYGAIVDDQSDDRAAIQAAIDAAAQGARCVTLSAGEYHVTRDPRLGTPGLASLKIAGQGMTISGAGNEATTITMLGSGIRPGTTNPGDWHLIGATAPLVLRDLRLDGADRVQTGEQTHLLHLGVGSHDNLIERVDFSIESIGPSSGGDCIRLVGSSAVWNDSTAIRDVTGYSCDRAFISLQRYVSDLEMLRVESVSTEVALDFEPTGSPIDCNPVIDRVTLDRSVLRRGANSGSWTATIAGLGCATAAHVLIRDSVIGDGGMIFYDTSDVTLQNLYLANVNASAPLHIAKRAVRFRAIGLDVTRADGTGTGQSIKVVGQSGAYPADVTLLGVRVTHKTEGTPVLAEDLGSLTVIGSAIDYEGPTSDSYAITVRGINIAAGRPLVADTTIAGPMAGAVRLTGTTDGGQPVLVRVSGP